MPARYRRPSRPYVRPRRRQLVWVSTGLSTGISASNTLNTDLLSPLRTAGHVDEGLTVMAVHVQMSFPAATAAAWPWGIVVGRQSDVGAFLTSSAPLAAGTVANWPLRWLLLLQSPPTYSGATLDAVFNVERFVKARRRVPTFDDALMLSVTNPSSSQTQQPGGFLRVLVALP